MTRRILIANPNTSASITARMVGAAQTIAGSLAHIDGMTAPFGAPALTTEVDLSVAADAVEAMLEGVTCDGAIVAAFGDPGFDRVRQSVPFPVAGIGEAGIGAAAAGGRAFAILTLGPDLKTSIEARVRALGLTQGLIGIRFLEAGILDVAAAPHAFTEAILNHAWDCAAEGAAALLLGGAPFSGLARDLSRDAPIPILDGLTSAMERLLKDTDGG